MGIRTRCDPAIELIEQAPGYELEPGDDMGLMLLFALKDNPTRAELERLCRELNTMAPEQADRCAEIVGVGLLGTDAYEIWRDLTSKIEESAASIRSSCAKKPSRKPKPEA
jgi:hypothetical protein